jgi:hypothetical protein
MGWNHRVLAHKHNNEIYFKIHEVYYDAIGKPDGYTANAVCVSAEDINSIIWTLDKMKECIEKPILWAGSKFPQEFNSEPNVQVSDTTGDEQRTKS